MLVFSFTQASREDSLKSTRKTEDMYTVVSVSFHCATNKHWPDGYTILCQHFAFKFSVVFRHIGQPEKILFTPRYSSRSETHMVRRRLVREKCLISLGNRKYVWQCSPCQQFSSRYYGFLLESACMLGELVTLNWPDEYECERLSVPLV